MIRDPAPVSFLPPLSTEPPQCMDCQKAAETRAEVVDGKRGLLLVCYACQRSRAAAEAARYFTRDPFAS